MGRRFALTDDQVRDIQAAYQRSRHRGAIQDLMARFGASRNTINAALRKTVPEKSSTIGKSTPSDLGIPNGENACRCTEATDPLLTICGHPVTCQCRGCQHHSIGLRVRFETGATKLLAGPVTLARS